MSVYNEIFFQLYSKVDKITNKIVRFTRNYFSCLFAADAAESKARAWNYALRYKQKNCARYLLSKCFAKVPVGRGINAHQISITVRNY